MAHRPCFMGAGCGRVDVEPCGDPILGGVGGGFLQERAAAFPWERNRDPHGAGLLRLATGGPKPPGEEWTGGQVSRHAVSGADRREGRPPGTMGRVQDHDPAVRPRLGGTAACWEEATRYPGAHALDGTRGQVESICLEVRGHPTGKETQVPRVTRLRRNSRGGSEGAQRGLRGGSEERLCPGVAPASHPARGPVCCRSPSPGLIHPQLLLMQARPYPHWPAPTFCCFCRTCHLPLVQ